MSLQPPPDPAAIARAAELIESADALITAAGAGMSVDSELPDFRDNAGFWNTYPALAQARLEFTRTATPAAFERNPKPDWSFYGHRLKLYNDTRLTLDQHPQNAGHFNRLLRASSYIMVCVPSPSLETQTSAARNSL